jgi:hypothetical protein
VIGAVKVQGSKKKELNSFLKYYEKKPEKISFPVFFILYLYYNITPYKPSFTSPL